MFENCSIIASYKLHYSKDNKHYNLLCKVEHASYSRLLVVYMKMPGNNTCNIPSFESLCQDNSWLGFTYFSFVECITKSLDIMTINYNTVPPSRINSKVSNRKGPQKRWQVNNNRVRQFQLCGTGSTLLSCRWLKMLQKITLLFSQF